MSPDDFTSSYIERMMSETPLGIQDGSLLAKEVGEQIDTRELIQLCAVDTELFAKTFFRRAFRQESPSFAHEMWNAFEANQRLINLEVFRGGGKTTRARILLAKNIAYGLSHTILVVGKSEGHSRRTIRWLMRQIEFNSLFVQTYQLRRGDKWTDVECEIWHGVDEYPITIIGMGITGSIRGINQDDFRPDLILMDDIHDEENSATKEQRQKIEELVYGAILESLAPASEASHAKLVNLFTPLNKLDVGCMALEDKAWRSTRIPIWTKETWNSPTHLQESVWPARWPSSVIRKEKEQAAARNKLTTWLREKELKLVSPETSSFRGEWLKRWTVLPENLVTFLAIDPVPPPSQLAVSKGLHKHDFESIAVVGIYKGNYYLLALSINRGHDPSWTRAEFFRLARRWHPRRIFVEAVAYQRTLAWILRQEMQRKAIYFPIEEVTDQRSKHDRIVDGLNGVTSEGRLLLPPGELDEGMKMFVEQFEQYPNVNHDDALESVAVAVSGASGRWDQDWSDDDALNREKEEYPRLAYSRGSP
jgi:hypothetical protein